jgi:predicted Zn-ribbon and HTH transcriptional regulator
MVSVKIVCKDCGYNEEHERQKGESWDGTTCPSCEGTMNEAEDKE